MLDLNKLKAIMKQSHDKRLVVLDDEESYILISLDEYQRLLENDKLVAQIKTNSSGVSRQPITSHEAVVPDLPYAEEDSYVEVNETLNELKQTAPASEDIRYENLSDDYSEEPI